MELNRVFRIGTRKSPLALRQVEEIIASLKGFYPELNFEIIGIDTYGDKDKITPISDIEGTDFFTREIEEALLRKEIDFAVHSAKDLPDKIPDGLHIAAITESIDPYDAVVLRQSSLPTLSVVEGLVSKDGSSIDGLKLRAKIGASSKRRKSQLKHYRPDFQIVDIRGNIEERLKKLDESNLDAIIVAGCAMIRLGLEDRIVQRIPFDILKPHPLQGSLALEVRAGDKDLINLLSILNDTKVNYKMP